MSKTQTWQQLGLRVPFPFAIKGKVKKGNDAHEPDALTGFFRMQETSTTKSSLVLTVWLGGLSASLQIKGLLGRFPV